MPRLRSPPPGMVSIASRHFSPLTRPAPKFDDRWLDAKGSGGQDDDQVDSPARNDDRPCFRRAPATRVLDRIPTSRAYHPTRSSAPIRWWRDVRRQRSCESPVARIGAIPALDCFPQVVPRFPPLSTRRRRPASPPWMSARLLCSQAFFSAAPYQRLWESEPGGISVLTGIRRYCPGRRTDWVAAFRYPKEKTADQLQVRPRPLAGHLGGGGDRRRYARDRLGRQCRRLPGGPDGHRRDEARSDGAQRRPPIRCLPRPISRRKWWLSAITQFRLRRLEIQPGGIVPWHSPPIAQR